VASGGVIVRLGIRPVPQAGERGSPIDNAASDADTGAMSYDGPSLSEWLAEYRSRRQPTEVVLYRANLPEPVVSDVSQQRVAALRISRYDDPDNPRPTGGFYLFSLNEADGCVSDIWHEELDDAFAQAEYEFGLSRSDWTAVSAND
jgi:hypothetical protein